MYYIMYLTNLCNRRRWADPQFEIRSTRSGYTCRVRVNHREYTTDNSYNTEDQAREKAAESAYMICRNFSLNDGMYPGQKQGQAGVTQGLPVAIGTGRRSFRNVPSTSSPDMVDLNSADAYGGCRQIAGGDSSPLSSGSEQDGTSRRSSASSSGNSLRVCSCKRAYIAVGNGCYQCSVQTSWR